MKRIIAIDPANRGFGYAVLEDDPLQLVDWGVASCRRSAKTECTNRLARLIEEYRPSAIVMENCGKRNSRRCHEIGTFARNVARLAKKREVEIKTFTREEVRLAFSRFGATTQDEIAAEIAREFPELESRLPIPRGRWRSEDYRMSIFDAVALAITSVKSRRSVDAADSGSVA